MAGGRRRGGRGERRGRHRPTGATRPRIRSLALLALSLACSPPAVERPPNVVLLTLESLRPDHVGFQDGTRDTTPALDRLAAESVVYEDAHSVTSWTLTSHASLLTGLYPGAHQAVNPLDRLGDGYLTLAEALQARGYATAGVVSGPYLRLAHNLAQGFEHFDDSLAARRHVEAHGDVTNPGMLERLERVLDERDPSRPLFLFGYFWDPHYDYLPPPPYDRMFVGEGDRPVEMHGYGRLPVVDRNSPPEALSYVRSQYDGEIRWTDSVLGRFFERLREAGIWDETLIVVTADHGEEFFEHGWKGHKNNLYVESVHVPLLVKYPGGRPRGRDGRLASLVDVFPTVLEATGTPCETPLHGRSLLAPDPDPARAIFFALRSLWYWPGADGEEESQAREWWAVRQADHKLVGIPEARMFLFDVRRDPRERTDLAGKLGSRAAELSRLLDQHRARMQEERARYAAGGEATLAREDMERLRALGYLR